MENASAINFNSFASQLQSAIIAILSSCHLNYCIELAPPSSSSSIGPIIQLKIHLTEP